MNTALKALCASLMLATATTSIPAYAQPAAPDRGERGDRDGHRDRDWDRDRGEGRGDHRGGGRHRDHDDDIGGAIIGGVIGGLLGGSNYNYRFRYDNYHDYYTRRGYDRGYYDRWRNRDRGYGGCRILGYRHGCRTVYESHNFIILNLRGDIYCYRRGYGGWRNTYCPNDWYRY